MSQLKAEVMSVGDEIVSGQRLDTNTQWISHALDQLGIPVSFHSTVGDDLDDHVLALQIAIDRCDLLLITGGLGPTADDLTREALAQAAAVELEFEQGVVDQIQKIYKRYGRVMPESNRSQAYFPTGSKIIPNPEGTAPGIDLTIDREGKSSCRVFAIPGVPAEMKQMWQATIGPTLAELAGDNSTIHHHTLHCFGAGESTIESMLPDLIQRGRDPQVGITASAATISLRISTRCNSKIDCHEKIQPTIALIHERLGNLVFGQNGQTLQEVVRQMLQTQNLKVAISESGLGGDVTRLLVCESNSEFVVSVAPTSATAIDQSSLTPEAARIRECTGTDWAIAIGPLDDNERKILSGKSFFDVALAGPGMTVEERFRHGGHSAYRKERAIKQVLNFMRLNLTSQ